MTTKFGRIRITPPRTDEVLGSYVAWSVLSEYLPAYDVWTLSTVCKTLHHWLNKEHPKNSLAIERSKRERRCCRCGCRSVDRHPLHPQSPFACYMCKRMCLDLCMVSSSAAYKKWGYRPKYVKEIPRSFFIDRSSEHYRAYLLTDVFALPDCARIRYRNTKEKQRREDDLRKELRAIGLELPKFDTACEAFISDEMYDGNAHKISDEYVLYCVVQHVAEQKMLHEYWDYSKLQHRVRKNLKSIVYTRVDFDMAVEKLALEIYGGYPKTWPWLN